MHFSNWNDKYGNSRIPHPINMYSSTLLALVLLGAASSDTVVSAFGPAAANSHNRIHVRTRTGTRTTTSTSQPSPTALFLEDRIAALIDGELVREGRLKEWEAEFAGECLAPCYYVVSTCSLTDGLQKFRHTACTHAKLSYMFICKVHLERAWDKKYHHASTN
jgi:hypothetical protein